MTTETKPAVALDGRNSAWPFPEELDAQGVTIICSKAAQLQRDEHKSLPASIALALINTRINQFFSYPGIDSLLDQRSRRLATSPYRELLYAIPLTELTISFGLPKHSPNSSNYLDHLGEINPNLDPPITEKVQRFLRFQRYAALLKQDPTAMAMLENGVMSEFLESTKKAQNGQSFRILLEFGQVSSVSDLLKPEVKSTLTPSTLACLQAYVDYRKIYVAAFAPEMI